ncbi:MAG: hypothetical protein LBH63_05635 [Clostridiales Family XIII bacterium]|jgi:hypothetical protein|nr:hypothetical protein [Clostridiales Family XIII bacterium]
MYCKTCGNLLDDNDTVCGVCGTAATLQQDKPDEARPASDDASWPWHASGAANTEIERIAPIIDSQTENASPFANTKSEYEQEAEEYARSVANEETVATPNITEPPSEERRDLFKKPDFSWDTDIFSTDKQRKTEDIDFKWGETPPSPGAAINAAAYEKAVENAVTERVEKGKDVFMDDTFRLRMDPDEESRFMFSKKNEEFQELLDEEFEKIRSRQTEIDEERNRINEEVMSADVATPKTLVTGENALKTAEDRIAEFLQRADREMLERINQKVKAQIDEFDRDGDAVPIDEPPREEVLLREEPAQNGGEHEGSSAETDLSSGTDAPYSIFGDLGGIASPFESGNAAVSESPADVIAALYEDVAFPPYAFRNNKSAKVPDFVNETVVFPFDEIADTAAPVAPEASAITEPVPVASEMTESAPEASAIMEPVPAAPVSEVKAAGLAARENASAIGAFATSGVHTISGTPEMTESAPEASAITEPAPVAPAITEPAPTAPAITEPVPGAPEMIEPALAAPEMTGSVLAAPEMTGSVYAGPEISKPAPVAPKSTSATSEPKPEAATKKPKTALMIILDILVVLAVLSFAVFSILKFVPDSGAAEFINKGIDKIEELFGGAKDEGFVVIDLDKDDGFIDTETETIPPVADKDTLVASQLFNNINIKQVFYDPNAVYSEGVDYPFAGAAESAPIDNDYWTVDEMGRVLYDEAAVAAVIRFNSKLIDCINNGGTEALSELVAGSAAQAKFADEAGSSEHLEIDSLGIGDIRQNEGSFFVWTIETVTETKSGVATASVHRKLYQLTPDISTMQISDYAILD